MYTNALSVIASLLLLPVLQVAAIPQTSATTTAYEAPRPSGVPGGSAGFTYTTVPAGGLVGGNAGATGGPLGGAVSGTAQGGGTLPPQATGNAGGSLGGSGGKLAGGAGFGGVAGCAGGQVQGVGFTTCISAPLPKAS